jgi:hypothetical protein
MNEMTNTSSMPKTIFSLAIILYLIVFGAMYVFVSYVFGPGAAVFLSLIPFFPLIIAIRMHKKWLTLKGRQFVYLGILLIITFCAVPGLVWYWYDLGMDHIYAVHLERVKFVDYLHDDPAFRNLMLVERKGCWLEGTVPTKADLVRLKSILDQNQSIGCDDVTIR